MRARLNRFGPDAGGMALVEFAMVLPAMALLYMGGVAVTQGMMTHRKVTLMTRSLGDIIAQDTSVTQSEVSDIFSAAKAVMTPYSTAASVLGMTVSSVKVQSNGKTCVEWSLASGNATARSNGSTADDVVPASMRVKGTWIVMPEVTYVYTPVIGKSITGTINMSERLFLSPRQSASVTSYNQPTKSPCT